MAKLKITRASGDVVEVAITPVIEVAFEQYAKKGFGKAFREDEKQGDIYWIAWKCLSMIGDEKPYGENFLATLHKVEVLDDQEETKNA